MTKTFKKFILGLAVSVGALFASSAQAGLLVQNIDVTGIKTYAGLGSAENDKINLNLGGSFHVTGFGWDVLMESRFPSVLGEMWLRVSNTAGNGFFVDFAGTNLNSDAEQFSSGGLLDLVALGFDFFAGADGLVTLEFFEGSFDEWGMVTSGVDDMEGWDGQFLSGALNLQYVPEPGTPALAALALFGMLVASRRRRS